MRACPWRISPFSLIHAMKNHRWIAQELRKDHAQITNKPRTSEHRHAKPQTCAYVRVLLAIHTPILFFSDAYVLQARNMRQMSANRQWKVVDERDSGNILANDHWYSTHISRIVRVRTTQTTQNHVKQHNTAYTLTRSRELRCSKPGGRLNKKDGLTRYGDSHVKDKTS